MSCGLYPSLTKTSSGALCVHLVSFPFIIFFVHIQTRLVSTEENKRTKERWDTLDRLIKRATNTRKKREKRVKRILLVRGFFSSSSIIVSFLSYTYIFFVVNLFDVSRVFLHIVGVGARKKRRSLIT